MPSLLLGPLLRHVDETSATVWVETDEPCEVQVLGARTPTFTVAGHHYALVVCSDLRPGTTTPGAFISSRAIAIRCFSPPDNR